MRLLVATPSAVIVDAPDVVSLRAEDATGSFGILPRHADFLTVLAPTVLVWRDGKDTAHYLALRGGILNVRDGRSVEIMTRSAVEGDDLDVLQQEVVERLRAEAAAEAEERARAARLHLAFYRQIGRYIRDVPTSRRNGVLAAGSAGIEGGA